MSEGRRKAGRSAKGHTGRASHNVMILFDGGSRGNPGPAYGSFLIRGEKVDTRRPMRLAFGRGTNNEAEYLALIGALEELRERLRTAGIPAEKVRLEIRGDSKLVINQMSGRWRARNSRMRALRDRALKLLDGMGSVRFVQHDRRHSVAALGH